MPYVKNGKTYYSKADKAAFAKKMQAARNKRPAPAPRKKYTRTTDGAIGSTIGSTVGGFMGGAPGATLGGAIGKGAHQLFKAITGFGDYTVEHNTLMTGGMSPPQIINASKAGSFIVRHREYIGDINATIDFTVQGFPINPGLLDSFPWLGSVAPSFEEYKLRGLIYEFKSLSSDAVLSASTSSALGAVVMATDYNVLGNLFPNKMQMENYEFANSAKPSCSFLHPVECKKALNPISTMYVRSGAVPPNADQRLYDLGLFQIATVGMQAASGVCGELWCTYEVELIKPRFTTEELNGVYDHANLSETTDSAHPLGTGTPSITAGSNLGGSVDVSTQRYNFPLSIPLKGDFYDIQYLNWGNGMGIAVTAPNIILSSGLTLVNAFGGGAASLINCPTNAVVTDKLTQNFIVTVNDDSGQLYIEWDSNGTIPNGEVSLDLIVSKINNYVA